MPKISVIIPGYNHEKFLPKRIESALGQSVHDIEVIILDDASTDDSMSVIKRYAGDLRVRIIPNQINSGNPFIQWNRGVREAIGEYVWIAESDDYADSRFLEVLASRLDKHPNVGLAYCDSFRVNAEGVLCGVYKDYYRRVDPQHWVADFIASGKGEILGYLLDRNSIPNASGVLFRRAIYERSGGASTDLRLCGDWLMWIKMLLISDLAYVAEPMNYFRCHDQNVRTASGDFLLHKEHYQVLKYVEDHLRIKSPQMKAVLGRISAAWACSIFDRKSWEKWRHLPDVYRAACTVDPHPVLRLVWFLGLHYPWRLREALRSRKKTSPLICTDSH